MIREKTPDAAFQLLPEWAEQEAVVLVWPDEQTDWAYILDEIRQTYVEFIEAIARYEAVWLVARDTAAARAWLAGRLSDRALEAICWIEAEYNDTWARDTMPLTLSDGRGRLRMMDFRFNGWGEKFASDQDNQLGRVLQGKGVFRCPMDHWDDFVLEGGSVEADGEGHLFTTSVCLLAPHRNQPLTQGDLDERLRQAFGVDRVYWIGHGSLDGDDTDGHIDTLVRCAPGHTLLYVGCDDEADPQYADLQAMEADLQAINREAEVAYRLLRLPMPDTILDEEGNRLPATYANFLIVNGAVIVPTYDQPHHDAEALRVVGEAFPEPAAASHSGRGIRRKYGKRCPAVPAAEPAAAHRRDRHRHLECHCTGISTGSASNRTASPAVPHRHHCLCPGRQGQRRLCDTGRFAGDPQCVPCRSAGTEQRRLRHCHQKCGDFNQTIGFGD